ncbi:hypothetical protein GCM10010470_35940 [Saccharopolyspora taberi]|uniref:Secreted protein n=1 Tax=Saccharopolyspora taberi TaxID=60895 RepID=A0ABN3VFF4_9PSEU
MSERKCPSVALDPVVALAPMVIGCCRCPGWTSVSSGNGSNRSRMDATITPKSEQERPVAPGRPDPRQKRLPRPDQPRKPLMVSTTKYPSAARNPAVKPTPDHP